MSKKNGAVDCKYRQLSEKLREKAGVPYASAKLEIQDGSATIVEYVRGKDLARYLRAHPEKMEGLVKPAKDGRTVEDQIRDLVHFFVHKGLLLRTERKYKQPKPGRKLLVKFPKTIIHCAEQNWDEAYFYAWQFERPTSLWYYVAVVALPLVVVGACLFPLAPWWMRLAFVYTLMFILMVLLGMIAIRYVVFSVVWTVSGYSLWLFPNMMSEEVGVLDAFSPLISCAKPEPGKSQWKQRALGAVALGFVFYVLYSHHPDVDTLKDEAMKAHESLFDYLDLAGKKKMRLDGETAPPTAGTGTGAGPGTPGGPHA